MSDNNQQNMASIMVNNQYIKDLSLEIPFAPDIFMEEQVAPKMNIDVNIDARKLKDNQFCVELSINMNADMKDKKLFVLELVYGSIVEINVPEEHLEPVLLIEIPRLMFPFVRSIITNTLVDGGLPPFMLNPIDFVAMYQAKKASENENQNKTVN